MKRDRNNKERRKVVVRGKGKTYTRTMLVNAARDIGKRESLHQIKLEQANHQPSTMSKMLAKAKSGLKGVLPNRNVGALHSLHPWQEHHTEGVKTGESQLGGVQKFYGSSGPGSDHSLYALAVGARRDHNMPAYQKTITAHGGSREQAERRQLAGELEASFAQPHASFLREPTTARGSSQNWSSGIPIGRSPINNITRQLAAAFGGAQVSHVPQNHKKWVR